MFTMEQFWSLVRTLLQTAGAALVTRGYMDDGSMQMIVGATMTLLTTGYSLYIRRKAGLVASAAALPEVIDVKLKPTDAGQAIKEQVADPTVQVAK
ncbi:hypothetical protein [Bosea sp. BK604]|uniref:Pam3-gp28 family putative phage holin n=1 Tax=Bosea sp. BK604 TaxID=2512180 RepID=UPI001046CE77|nr:hypothetical protein [Bosea sp. BK604]TCR60925.1 hypothetical protein EV560_115150 [Bosea sp. BK604]